ncbi:D-amino acid dehydrogenase [Marichromatium gracile]|uniref:D-amino-acid dehydrogenase n=1 Tax=Marichromatium gracile TaxID=1048 RepID=A0A4R4A608_MARGR|nr:D-amino acid dehydrogenase [Marichromatium gracile]MBK1710213.1 D-amino acid dehydrogenase small subunit [Marichromatium gracile]TCW33356.1 D-amino-acid dehydrogenase [Marichromatium gracile]
MRVLVIGSGVIGTTAAYQLARAGAEVTVLERCAGSGLETSYANAGQVSTGYAAPWAAPGLPLKALRWLLTPHAPLRVRPRLDAAMLRFMAATLGNCSARHYARNKARLLRLAEYSRIALGELRAEIGIDYDAGQGGTLQLLRSAAQFDQARRDRDILERSGLRCELLDVEGCVRHEPALARVADRLAGGLRFPDDETGDCLRFTQALAGHATRLGVEFRYGVRVEALRVRDGAITGVETDAGPLVADRCLLAAGLDAVRLLRPLGIRAPIHPVKGYSLTLPLLDPEAAPRSTLMDETNKVALTRLGNRLRVAGTAELCGMDLRLRSGRLETLRRVLVDLFPEAADPRQAEPWAGLRPMTPDGPPILGESGCAGLYLDIGHGSLGWTLSCGSARLIADLMLGRAAAIDPEGLTLARYRGGWLAA